MKEYILRFEQFEQQYKYKKFICQAESFEDACEQLKLNYPDCSMIALDAPNIVSDFHVMNMFFDVMNAPYTK